MTGGVQRGWPTSALEGLLFISSTEIMNVKLRKNNKVEGFQINRTKQKLFPYADDTTLIVQSKQSVTETISEIDSFGKISG